MTTLCRNHAVMSYFLVAQCLKRPLSDCLPYLGLGFSFQPEILFDNSFRIFILKFFNALPRRRSLLIIEPVSSSSTS